MRGFLESRVGSIPIHLRPSVPVAGLVWATRVGQTASLPTDDFHVHRLHLAADRLMPRMRVRTVKEREDVGRCRYLLPNPADCDLQAWREQMGNLVAFGGKEGFPVALQIPHASGVAMKNMGTLEIVLRAADGDPTVQELFDALTDWALQWIDYGARLEPDIIYYSGVYESTDFWSPSLFRRYFAPIHR